MKPLYVTDNLGRGNLHCLDVPVGSEEVPRVLSQLVSTNSIFHNLVLHMKIENLQTLF